MMNKKMLTINSDNFHNLETFYVEIDNVLTKNLDWQTGHNFNAFNDLLCGGFGIYEYEEQVEIKWINFAKSKVELGDELVNTLVEIIESHADHVKLSIIN